MSPPGDSRGGPLTTDRPTAENPGEKFTSNDTRRRRERALRRALHDAERRRDGPSAALLRAWLLDEAA